MPSRRLLLAALCLLPTIAFAQMATAPFEGRLKQIHETKTISVAYRTDALPFSFEEADKKPAGYTVDLCRGVIAVIERQLGVAPLQVKWVPVTTQTRFSAIASGQADMECGASTVTLGRMKEVVVLDADVPRRHRPPDPRLHRRQFADRPVGQEDRRDRRHEQRARAQRGLEDEGRFGDGGEGQVARGRARAARSRHARRLRERPRPPPRPDHESQEPEEPGVARRRLVVSSRTRSRCRVATGR